MHHLVVVMSAPPFVLLTLSFLVAPGVAGCAGASDGARDESTAVAAPAGREEASPAEVRAEEPAAERVTLPEPVVTRLTAGIEALSVRTPRPTPATIAEAFRALAAAFELLSPSGTASPQKLRDLADRLAGMPRGGAAATEETVKGLESIMGAMTAMDEPSDQPDAFRASVNELSAAVEEIDRRRSLAAEAETVSRALRAAADAVLIAGGQTPRFASAPRSLPPGSRRAFMECVPELRSRVRALAAARYPGEREAAVRALTALADCLVAAPGKTEEVERSIGEVRFQTTLIRSAPSLAPRETGWIRAALLAALDALDALSGLDADDDPGRSAWVAAARRSTEAIDTDTGLVFQRAPVQDAFRAVTDAVAAAARAGAAREP